MGKFKALFGIKESEIKRNCIITPLITKDIIKYFGLRNLSKGRLYNSSSSADFTLIHTGMVAGLVGDAVLYLKDTPCRNAILFGSCGLVKEKRALTFGSLVSPYGAYSNESFSNMLLEKKVGPGFFPANKTLYENFLKTGSNACIKKVLCSTVASLKLEEDMLKAFCKKEIDILDMECSAFFSASLSIGIKAIALFYVSDIIGKMPFYADSQSALKSKLIFSVKKSVDFICQFIEKNQNA